MSRTRSSAAAACLAVLMAAAPAHADGYRTVTDKSDFVNLVNGRALTRLGIRLAVTPGGQISGRAFGADVTGAWTWSGDYFCRSLNYGKTRLEDNCQEVKVSGSTIRFTSDRGTGRSADLTIK